MKKTAVVLLAWVSSLALAGLDLSVGSIVGDFLDGTTVRTSLVAGAVVCALVAGLCAGGASWLGERGLASTEAGVRRRVVSQVFALGSAERTRERSGLIVSTATDGAERSAAFHSTFIAPMIASLTTPVIVLVVVALAIDPLSSGLLALAIPFVPLSAGAFQMAFRTVSKRYRASSQVLAAKELDAIQGLSTLALLNAGRRVGQRLARATEEVRREVMRYLAANQIVLLVVDAVFSLGMVTGAAVIALWRFDAGAIAAGQALSLVLMSSLLLEPLEKIGQFFYVGLGGITASKEISAFCGRTPTVVDAPGVMAPDRTSEPEGLRVEDVSFSYGEDVPVLRGAGLDVAPGEHVVLTGESGAGKSTIAALLQADRRPDSGRVLIGGHDLFDVPLSWTRDQFGVVAQETYLFTGTLRDNLLIAAREASDTALVDALTRARLSDLLSRLPSGLDTPVGERGLALSGGEAQRVAIARALLKDAPILLLDEPTAHVDLTSEREILEALEEVATGRTTVTISHRAATIEDADRELVLADGRITEVEEERA